MDPRESLGKYGLKIRLEDGCNSNKPLTHNVRTTMSNSEKNVINWNDESRSNSEASSVFLDESPLVELKVSNGESKIVVIWDGYAEQVQTHSLKQNHSNFKQTVLCREDNCPLCIAGEKVYARIVTPVYSVDSADMEILQFLKFGDYKSLYPQIKDLLKEAEFPLALEIRRVDKFAYEVRDIEVPADKLERIKKPAEEFLTSVKNGTTNMLGIFKEIDESLLNDPNLRRKLEFKGYDYRKFFVENHAAADLVNHEFVL